MVLSLKRLSKLPPRVAELIEAETLRQEDDIGETFSFFVANLTRTVVTLREWNKSLPDVLPFYGECDPCCLIW